MIVRGAGFLVEGTLMHWGVGGELLHHHIRVELDAAQDLLHVDSHFVARKPLDVTRAEGLSLHVANDVFNDYTRTFLSDAGAVQSHWAAEDLAPPVTVAERVRRKLDARFELDTRWTGCGRHWVNVDGKLGIVALTRGEFWMARSRYRSANDSLHYDLLTNPRTRRGFRVQAGDTIVHTRVVLVAGDAERTRQLATQLGAGTQ